MIQTIAGISPAAELQGAFGAASGQGDSPFLALLTQALGAQSGKSGVATESVFAALLGNPGGGASEGGLPLAVPDLEDATPAQPVSLAGLLGKGLLGGTPGRRLGDTSTADSAGTLPVGLGGTSSGTSPVNPAGALAKVLRPRPEGDEDSGKAAAPANEVLVAVLTGIPSAEPSASAVPSSAGNAGSVLAAGLEGRVDRLSRMLAGQPAVAAATDDGGEEAEFASTADAADGKKLPPSLAAFAGGAQESARGREVAAVRAAASDGMPAVALKSDPAALVSTAVPPSTLQDSTVVAQGSGPAAPQVPQSGHELAMSAARGPGQHSVGDKVEIHIQSNLGSQAWQREVGDRLVWLAGRQGQSAELILNPPSLGAIEVRLNLSGGEASAQFFSANPNVREVLESALPRLREMLGSAGIALGEAMVSNQSFSHQDGARQGGSGQAGGGGFAASDNADAQSASGTQSRGTSLLDYFA